VRAPFGPIHAKGSALACLLALWTAGAHAQDPSAGSTPVGLAAGAPSGSYATTELEHVNYFNGSLNLSIPLLKIGGRGGVSTTLTLAVDPTWTVQDLPFDQWYPYFETWAHIVPGYGPGVLVGRSVASTTVCSNNPTLYTGPSLTRLTFTLPDLTEIEFRDVLSDGNPYAFPACTVTPPSRGRLFVTNDGSSATFEADADVLDVSFPLGGVSTVAPSGYLMMRDGTRYRIQEGLVQWMRDRSGNRIEFKYVESGPYIRRVREVKDPLNRIVTITYSDAQDVITYNFAPGPSGTRSIVIQKELLENAFARPEYQTQLIQDLFVCDAPWLLNCLPYPHNPLVPLAVHLPNGKQYTLSYNEYAELEHVELPTGGRYEYVYEGGRTGLATHPTGVYLDGPPRIYRRLVERRTLSAAEDLLAYTTISRPEGDSVLDYVEVDIYDVVATGSPEMVRRERHHYHGHATDSITDLGPFEYAGYREGREHTTEIFASDGGTPLRRLFHTWENGGTVAWFLGPGDPPAKNPRIHHTETEVLGGPLGALRSRQDFLYDAYNNRTRVDERAFGAGTPGALVRRTNTAYLASYGAYTGLGSVHIRDLVESEEIRDGADVLKARTEFQYDQYGVAPNGALFFPPGVNVSGMDTAYASPGIVARGNPTRVKRWGLTPATSDVLTYSDYDLVGNVVKSIDGKGFVTQFFYDDNFGGPNSNARTNIPPIELGGASSRALVTRMLNPLLHETFVQYDFYHAQPVDSEDENNVVSTTFYDDVLNRPTRSVRSNSHPSAKVQTLFQYGDAPPAQPCNGAPLGPRVVLTCSDKDAFDDKVLVSDTRYDEFGREDRLRQFVGGSTVVRQTAYDGLGRIIRVSNPFSSNGGSAEDSSSLVTLDALDRVVLDLAPKQPGEPEAARARTETLYEGNETLVTDPAGKQRRTITDALGRVASVVEYTGGSPSTLSTSYAYDAVDGLLTVTQGGQVRTFTYDGLGRIRTVTNPESGTITYTYDANGNLATRIDALSVTTSYGFDPLDRPVTRGYSSGGGDPVAFAYDGNGVPPGTPSVPFAKGRLTAASRNISSRYYTEYDPFGRVLKSQQLTDGFTYPFQYSYDRAGNLRTQTYPSGRVITTTYDVGSRPSSVMEVSVPFAEQILYAPHGAPTRVKLGNGRWETSTFNTRLQAEAIRLGASDGSNSDLQLGLTYRTTGGSTPSDNNGNLRTQSISIPGVFSVSQSYGYDTFNRLQTATETGGAGWSQTYTYDRWGNRAVTQSTNVPLSPLTPTTLTGTTGYNPANNRIAASLYFATGAQQANSSGHTFTYDAEGRIATSAVGGVTTNYSYDAEDRRSRTQIGSSGARTVFVYDAFGRLALELADDPPGSPSRTYVTPDHLGSTRVTTDKAGVVLGRHDYLPFGEELSVNGRTAALQYGAADGIKQRFTGKERDGVSGVAGATGLDYFGARYLSSQQGRFVSADVPLVGQSPSEPQSWNLYQYTANNPLNRTDPHGYDWFHANGYQPFWLNCDRVGSECARLENGGWNRWMPSRPGAMLDVDHLDGIFHLGVDADGDPTSSYTGTIGMGRASGPVEGLIDLFTGSALVKGGARGAAAARGPLLLGFSPVVKNGSVKWGLEHILRKHSFNSGVANVSKFARGMGFREIKSLIAEAGAGGSAAKIRIEGTKAVLEMNMGRVIGTTPTGAPTSWLRVAIAQDTGVVVSAYPIPRP
jgi:RHS repeat-associated protein